MLQHYFFQSYSFQNLKPYFQELFSKYGQINRVDIMKQNSGFIKVNFNRINKDQRRFNSYIKIKYL